MILKAKIILSLFFIFLFGQSNAQFINYSIKTGQSFATIPFEMHNDFIVLPVMLDGKIPLNFILDTGASNTIVIHREYTDIIGVGYTKRLYLKGVDQSRKVSVLLTDGVDLELPEITAKDQNILVLEDSHIDFDKYSGTRIHGILGLDLFRRFIVKIDYSSRFIYLFEPESHKFNIEKYSGIPLIRKNKKIYLAESSKMINHPNTEIKWLVDTGAALTLLIQNNESDSLLLPQHKTPGNIGRGLGGYILGYIGKIKTLKFGDYHFENVICNFQEIPDSVFIQEFPEGKRGIIGNKILKQFHLVFDYQKNILYARANKFYKTKEGKELSGLSIIASGLELNQFSIEEVFPGSPGKKAGLQPGDSIKKINGKSTYFMNLQKVEQKLNSQVGKNIKLIIKRGKEKLKKEITLEEYL